MRPARFQDLLVTAARTIAATKDIKTLAEIGHTEHPFGIAMLLTTGAQVWWSFTTASRPGDDYTTEEPPPVTGQRTTAGAPAAPGQITAAYLEAALAAALVEADREGEIAAVVRYSGSGTGRSISHGVRVDFHDTSKAFVNGLASVRADRTAPSGEWYTLPHTI